MQKAVHPLKTEDAHNFYFQHTHSWIVFSLTASRGSVETSWLAEGQGLILKAEGVTLLAASSPLFDKKIVHKLLPLTCIHF